MIRTQISMTEDQAEALRRLAELRKKSQAALVREALDALVHDDERLLRVERARRAVGTFSSGHARASEDHDEILDRAFDT